MITKTIVSTTGKFTSIKFPYLALFYSPLRTSVATEVKATLISLIKIKRGTSDLIIKDEMFSRRQIFPCLSFVSDFTCMHSLECLFFSVIFEK